MLTVHAEIIQHNLIPLVFNIMLDTTSLCRHRHYHLDSVAAVYRPTYVTAALHLQQPHV
jgi:hypothetical protein